MWEAGLEGMQSTRVRRAGHLEDLRDGPKTVEKEMQLYSRREERISSVSC